MSRKTTLAGAGALVVVVVLAMTVSLAFGQKGSGKRGAGQRGPGAMGGMMYLERTWTAVSFQLSCTSQQLEKLRPTYRTALKTRNAALKKAMEARDWKAVGTAMQKCKSTLDAKLKAVLSSQQWQKLQAQMKPRMGGMRRGGGQ